MRPAAWPVALLAAVALLPTWRFLFGGRVPAPVDQVHQLPPWNGPKPGTPWDILQLDGALQFLPWRDYMLSAMREGEVPLWNPYSLGGIPFLANSQSAPLYPLHWLWALTPFDAEWLLSFSAWLHLFIAGLGVYLLCRRLGASELGGLIGGTGFTLSAFMVAWIQLPSVIMTAAWIPWCLLGVLRLIEGPSPRSVAKLAAPLGLLLLAGHLQIAGYGLMAALLYAVWLAAFKKRWRACALPIAAALTVGFMLAAPQLLPVLENGRNGHRSGPPTAEGWEAYQRQALDLQHLAVFFAPTIFGMPNEKSERLPEAPTAYWLAYEEPGRHYAELAFWVGPIVLPMSLFALVAFWRRPEVAFFGVLAAVGLLIALGTWLTKFLYFAVPGWSATGSPGRATILSAVGLSVFAGLAVQSFAAGRVKLQLAPGLRGQLSKEAWLQVARLFFTRAGLREAYRADGALLLVMLVYCALWALARYLVLLAPLYGSPPDDEPWTILRLEAAKPSVILFAISAIAIFPVLMAVMKKNPTWKHPERWAVTVLLVSVFVLAGAQWNLNPGSERGHLRESLSGLKQVGESRVAVVNESWLFLRAARNAVAPPNSLLPYRIKEIGGYDSIVPRETKQRLDEINGRDSAPPANGNMMFLKPGFDPERLKQAGVDYVLSAAPLPFETVFEGQNWKLYRLPGAAAPTASLETAAMLAVGPEAESRAYLSRLPAGWLQWSRREDGATLYAYRPRSYLLGTLLGLLGIGAIIALSCIQVKVRTDDPPA